MKNNKKNLWLSILAATLSLSFIACKDKDDNNNNPSNSSNNTGSKKINVHEWIQAKSFPNLLTSAVKVDLIAVSKDGNFVYATNDAVEGFAVADITSGIDSIGKDAGWKNLTLTPVPALAGTAGKAAGPYGVAGGRVKRFDVGEKGVLVSVGNGTAAATAGAIALVQGSTYKAAWACEAGTTHLDAACHASTNALYGGILKKANGGEYVYAAPTSTNDTVNTFSTIDTAALSATYDNVLKLDNNFTRTTAFTSTATTGPLWFVNANSKAMIINLGGISIYTNDAHIGAAQPIPNAVVGDAQPARWVLAVAPVAPTEIKDVAVLGTKVYLALNTGVFVYDDANSAATSNIDATWTVAEAAKLRKLAVDTVGSKVYAVMTDGLFDCTDGKKAAAALAVPAKPTDYSKITVGATYDLASKMPKINITDAKFVKGALIVATSDEGLFVRKAAKNLDVAE